MHRQKWSDVTSLSIRKNVAFAKLSLMKFRVHHSDYLIKSIRLDNAEEFTSMTSDDYCISLGICWTYSFLCSHPRWSRRLNLGNSYQASSVCIGLCNLACSHVGPVEAHYYPPYFVLQLVTGCKPDVSHLHSFGCAVPVPIVPPQRTKSGPQQKMGIYVDYEPYPLCAP